MPRWDPAQYLRFEGHRLRPALDLITRIGGEPRHVWDLGCGTGAITAILAERWPDAAVVGLDSSPEMLAEAQAIPSIRWELGEIADWDPGTPADLAFSNAALHWLGDHQELFPRLVQRVAKGGTLAVQMPRNFGQPSHTLLAEIAGAGRWRTRLAHLVQPAPVHPPDWYYDLLHPLTTSLDIWETEYLQVLDGDDPVARWTRGTAARPFLEALGDDAEDFMAEYASALREAYPRRGDGTTLFPFRRLFLVAQR